MYKLRELQKEDMKKINIWRNDIELINHLGAQFRYINLDVDNKWYDNYLQNRNSTIRCAIIEIENEENILGIVSLTNINAINQSAEFHIMIGNINDRGKGIGYYSTIEILKHAFNNLNINRIELAVLNDNSSALKLYNKAGFKKEGIKKSAIYKSGQFRDMTIMAILKEEFYK